MKKVHGWLSPSMAVQHLAEQFDTRVGRLSVHPLAGRKCRVLGLIDICYQHS